MSGTYRLLLRAPGAAAFFVTAMLGRVGIAMTSLGIIWLVHDRTGSYATAGVVTGAFAVAEGIVGPQVARLVDLHGQTRVLPPVLVVHALTTAGLVTCALRDAPIGWLLVSAAGMGASIPQLGALSSARWVALLRQSSQAELLPAAFSLESLSNATAYLVGPVLVSAVGATGHPVVGTATAAGLVVIGGGALAAQHRSAPPVGSGVSSGRSPGRRLLRSVFLLLVALNVAIGVYFGAVQVSVTARAAEHSAAGAAATLYAVSSAAGLVGGWLYGLRRWRARPAQQLLLATAGLAFVSLLATLTNSLAGLGLTLAVAGLVVPPILVLASVLAEQQVHRTVLTQAFTWLNSASAAGSAAAAAGAGIVIDAHAARGGFGLATVAALTMSLLAALVTKTEHTSRGLDRKPIDTASTAADARASVGPSCVGEQAPKHGAR